MKKMILTEMHVLGGFLTMLGRTAANAGKILSQFLLTPINNQLVKIRDSNDIHRFDEDDNNSNDFKC